MQHVIRHNFISLISALLFIVHSPTAVSELHSFTAMRTEHFDRWMWNYFWIGITRRGFYCEAAAGNAMCLSPRLTVIVKKCVYKTAFIFRILFVFFIFAKGVMEESGAAAVSSWMKSCRRPPTSKQADQLYCVLLLCFPHNYCYSCHVLRNS